MYKIACCDDDALFLTSLCKICEDILKRSNIEYQISTFSSFDSLYERCLQDTHSYDLLILDVLMQSSEDGITWGQRLRNLGISSSILYISSSKDYVFEGYDVQAIGYLLKPVDASLLERLLLKDYQSKHIQQRLILTKGSSVTSVILSDILYIESAQRTTLIYTENNTITCNLHLENILSQVSSDSFVRCHQSFIVNLSHVTMIRRYEVQLHNQHTVPISKAYFKTVQNEFIRFLRSESL